MAFDFDKHIDNEITLLDDPVYEITITYAYDRNFDEKRYKNSPWNIISVIPYQEFRLSFFCGNANTLIHDVVKKLKKIYSYLSDYGKIAEITCLIKNIDMTLTPININGYELYAIYEICNYLMFQDFENIQLCHLPNPYDMDYLNHVCYMTFKQCNIRHLVIAHELFRHAFYNKGCNIECMTYYYNDCNLYSRFDYMPERWKIEYCKKEPYKYLNELLTFMP